VHAERKKNGDELARRLNPVQDWGHHHQPSVDSPVRE
jgi:hypothetical protein